MSGSDRHEKRGLSPQPITHRKRMRRLESALSDANLTNTTHLANPTKTTDGASGERSALPEEKEDVTDESAAEETRMRESENGEDKSGGGEDESEDGEDEYGKRKDEGEDEEDEYVDGEDESEDEEDEYMDEEDESEDAANEGDGGDDRYGDGEDEYGYGYGEDEYGDGEEDESEDGADEGDGGDDRYGDGEDEYGDKKDEYAEGTRAHTPREIDETSESEWMRFSRMLSRATKDHHYFQHTASLAEARVFRDLARAQKMLVNPPNTTDRYLVVRSYERAPADGCIVVVEDETLDIPENTATDVEVWNWVKNQSDGIRIIPLDVKLWSQLMGSVNYYQWTKRVHLDVEIECYDILFIVIEGVPDHVAIVPNDVWRKSNDPARNIECLTSRVPTWLASYMVHRDHLPRALISLAQAAISSTSHYQNPTNQHIVRCWTPRSFNNVDAIVPICNQPGVGESYACIQELLEEIWAGGCRAYFNWVQPLVHDLYVWIPHSGLVRLEHKLLAGEQLPWDDDERRSALNSRRMWHVYYAQYDDGVLCFTRDELAAATAGTDGTEINEDFASRHIFRDFREVLAYLTPKRVNQARAAARMALRELRPEQLLKGLDAEVWKKRVRYIQTMAAEDNLLTELSSTQSLLPEVALQLNESLYRIGHGVCFPLGSGHAVGSHAVVEHDWTPTERDRFREHGELPFYWFFPGTGEKKCLVLRLEDHIFSESGRSLTSLAAPVGMRRGHWKKPIHGDKRHIILGTLLDGRGQATNDRLSWMLLLPSGFTTMFDSTNDRLKKLGNNEELKGDHIFRRVNIFDTELNEPGWPTTASILPLTHSSRSEQSFLAETPGINPSRYIFNLADDTIARQLHTIMQGTDKVRLQNPQSARPDANAEFSVEPYQWTVREVDEAKHDYGYEGQGREIKDTSNHNWRKSNAHLYNAAKHGGDGK